MLFGTGKPIGMSPQMDPYQKAVRKRPGEGEKSLLRYALEGFFQALGWALAFLLLVWLFA